MNKAIMGLSLLTIAFISVAMPISASANTISGNRGSIVKVSNTCTDMANVASNNRGSIVKIDGGGQCDINDILKSSTIDNNRGSIIKISNVCGDTSGLVKDNRGSIIKIDSTGPCKKDTPTTVVVTDKNEKDTTHVPAPTVTELPQTGMSLQTFGMAAAIGATAYIGAYFLNASRRSA
jgi:hypothetical protein